MSSEVIISNIQIWRQKCRDGTMTVDEQRQAIDAIRKDRIGATAISATSKAKTATAKAKAAPIDSDAMLDGLMG